MANGSNFINTDTIEKLKGRIWEYTIKLAKTEFIITGTLLGFDVAFPANEKTITLLTIISILLLSMVACKDMRAYMNYPLKTIEAYP